MGSWCMVLCIKSEIMKTITCLSPLLPFELHHSPLAKLVAMLLSGRKMHVTESCICGVCAMTGCANGQVQK